MENSGGKVSKSSKASDGPTTLGDQQVQWADLPLDQLCLVASSGASKSMREVCHTWKEGFDRSTTKISSAGPLNQDYDTPTPTDEIGALPNFRQFSSLRALNISTYDVSKLTRLPVDGLQRVQELSLDVCVGIVPSLIESLKEMPLLTKLDLSWSRIGTAELKGLPLTSLSLHRSRQIRENDLLALHGMPLTDLDLTGAFVFDPASLKGLFRSLSQLNKLSLNGIPAACKALEALNHLPLTSLNLCERCDGHEVHYVKNDCLLILKGLPLTHLDLSFCTKVRDGGVKNLSGLPLRHLNLGCSGVRDDGVKALQGLPLLSKLDLRLCEITSEGIRGLQGLKLTDLCLSGCEEIRDDGILALREMPLSKLNLGRCSGLTDDGFRALKGISLTVLDLSFCDLTDDGISGLVGMPLRALDLFRCQRLTSEALNVLAGLPLAALNVILCDSIKEEDLLPLKEAGVRVMGPVFDGEDYRWFRNLVKQIDCDLVLQL